MTYLYNLYWKLFDGARLSLEIIHLPGYWLWYILVTTSIDYFADSCFVKTWSVQWSCQTRSSCCQMITCLLRTLGGANGREGCKSLSTPSSRLSRIRGTHLRLWLETLSLNIVVGSLNNWQYYHRTWFYCRTLERTDPCYVSYPGGFRM